MPPDLLTSSTVESPCTKVCTLDAHGICIGCGRSVSEITSWSRLSVDEQRDICCKARDRRRQSGAAAT